MRRRRDRGAADPGVGELTAVRPGRGRGAGAAPAAVELAARGGAAPALASGSPAQVSLRAFGAVWFGYFATIGIFNPYAPLWFKELGFSTLAIGAIASLQAWTRVLAPYGWGWLGDHGGQRVRLLRLAALLALLAAGGLLVARGHAAVAVCTLALFLANGGVVPLSEASLAAHLNTASGLDTARYGRVRVWGSLGFIVSVVVAGAVLQRWGIALFPWLVVLMFVVLLAASLRLPARRDDVTGHGGAPAIGVVLRRPPVAWFFASVFFTVLAHAGLYAFFSLYLDSLGYAKTAVGGLWAVSVLVEIVFFWFQGRLFRRLAPEIWLQWAALASVLRFGITAAFGARPALLVAAQLLHVLTFAAQHAACIVLINRYFPGPLRGRGQALYTVLGYGLSGVIGGIGGGWLSARFGFAAVFWAAAGVAALGLACARQAAAAGAASR
jgi:PPP family 3-phenylpropionic acid transporter